jgi:EAL domain-containing protein (putative c-di-GMP-specific phosphodiesterase class I)
MAKNLDIETVAEWIETVEQLTLLSELGYKSMQDFYFGRPVPEAEFERAFLADIKTAEQRDFQA